MCQNSHSWVEIRTVARVQVLFYANSVSLSVKEKRLVREGFTEKARAGHQVQKSYYKGTRMQHGTARR